MAIQCSKFLKINGLLKIFYLRMSVLKFIFLLSFIIALTACVRAEPIAGELPMETTKVTAEQKLVANEVEMELIAAAARGDVETVKSLLVKGARVDAADEDGVTPLIAAAYGNHVDAARALIEAGSDVNQQDRTQQSAYLITTSEGYLELLELTLASGADVHSLDSYNGTGLIRAADRGHVEIIETLLNTDINVDHINSLSWTALLEAIILGDGGPRHTEVVRLLVEAGADIHLTDSDGVTPLEHARRRGYEEIVAILESADK